jgi:MFS transporter, DHA1 family, tetracycline resistance protein
MRRNASHTKGVRRGRRESAVRVKLFGQLVPILGITFIDIFGFSILIPIVPLFAKHFGASDLTAGLLFSTFAVFQFIAGPVWGHVSDLIGRKAVLIVSQVGATIGWTMLAYAHTLPMVFLARIVEGASGGNISVTQAYVADRVEPAQRARAFGYVGASFALGMVAGPLIGAPLYAKFGFSAPFLTAAALQFLTLVLTILMLPESRKTDRQGAVAGFRDILVSLGNPRLAPLIWQQWMFSLALYAWFGVFALFLQASLGYNVTENYYFFAGFSALSVLLQGAVVGPLSDRLGDRVTSTIGIACGVAAFCAVPFVHDLLHAAYVGVPFAFGLALARPCLTSLITAATPPDQRGVILGVGSALDNVSGIVMPPIATGLLGRYGPSSVGLPSTVFAMIALVLGLIATRKPTPQLASNESA